MVRAPFFDKNGVKKGAWSQEEDDKLRAYVEKYGHWNWRELPKYAGLSRCGKSCRLRWKNYLRPGVKHGNYSREEEDLIIKLHENFGNKWSRIAAELPGRTDNDIKNYWHTHLKNKKKKTENASEFKETQSVEQSSEITNDTKTDMEIENSLSHLILESYPLSPESSSSEFSYFTSDSVVVTASSTSITSSSTSAHSSSLYEAFASTSADDFWTQPFVAEQDGYRLPLQDWGIISPSVTCFEDSIDLFYQKMQEFPGN